MLKAPAVNRGLLAAVAAAATLTLIAPATGGTLPPRSATVRYGDLDLLTTAGRDRLDRRVRGAVDRVCPRPPIAELANMNRYRECRFVAQNGARDQVSRAVAQAQSREQVAHASEAKKGMVLHVRSH